MNGLATDPPPPRDLSNCAADSAVIMSAGNLTRIATALFRYTNQILGIFPPDLGTLYRTQNQLFGDGSV